LRDLGEKVPAEERGKIEGKINDLKQAAPSDDLSRIKKATDELQNVFYALSQQMYAQPGQTPPEGGEQGEGPQSPPPTNDGDVIDGEVRDA